MKSAIVYLVTLLAATLASQSWAAPQNTPGRVDAEATRIMQRAMVPGLVIAKVEHGRVRWQSAYGERAPGERMTLDTTFNVASLTKPVFATAVLALVADGKLTLDETLTNYWTDPDIANDRRHLLLTPRLLLSHQSGLPNWRGDRPLAFLFDPGQRHEYSGEGFEYLRRALELKTGSTLADLLSKKVFQKAGMSHSSSGWSETLGDAVAQGFDEQSKPVDTRLQSRRPSAAANLMTTAADYARFLAWVSRRSHLPKQLFDEMRRPQAVHANPGELFGLGWKLVPLGRENALMHDGREPGVRTWALVRPGTREALVILTNSSNGELTFRPLVEVALKDGRRVTASMDELVWRYLRSLPPEALVPMSRGIARSPSFLSTLLHSVDTELIQKSTLSREQKALAAARVDEYVLARLAGTVDAARAEKLVARLLVSEGDKLRLRTSFDSAAADEWVAALGL